MFGPATHQAFEEETGIDIDVVASSPGEGLVDLLQGRADLATAAVPLEAMLKLAAQAGIPMDPGLLVQTPIATNHTLVFVHPSNPVQRLSAGELRGIFTGKTTNWKEVGGTDRAIDVVWGSKTPGQNGLFTAQILGGAAVTAKAVGATDYRDIRQKVSEDPGAVGIDSDGFASGAVRIPETPDITSSIIVVTKGEPNPEVRRLLRFLAEVEGEL
jgi:phosphate transport system substrate-binding protein